MEVGAEGLKLSHFIVQIKLESQKKKKKKLQPTQQRSRSEDTHTHTQGPTAGLLQQVLATAGSGYMGVRKTEEEEEEQEEKCSSVEARTTLNKCSGAESKTHNWK